eukprot:TRINITY_DN3598_c1_g1_i3.p1 TRINITY_DN3598_c1_g1~~TRINITY_DN3598_c1_g1_i3.p1  ORF type:complete len:511 (-),score=46.44 TRINITY_DN3598_c1_g1_i3:378-1910(-)
MKTKTWGMKFVPELFSKVHLRILYICYCLLSLTYSKKICQWNDADQQCVAKGPQLRTLLKQSNNPYAKMWSCELYKVKDDCTQQEGCEWHQVNNSCKIDEIYLFALINTCVDESDGDCLHQITDVEWAMASNQLHMNDKGTCEVIWDGFGLSHPRCRLASLKQSLTISSDNYSQQQLQPQIEKNDIFCQTVYDIVRCVDSWEEDSENCQTCKLVSPDGSCIQSCAGKMTSIDLVITEIFDFSEGLKRSPRQSGWLWHPITDEVFSRHLFSDMQQEQQQSNIVEMTQLLECYRIDSEDQCTEHDPEQSFAPFFVEFEQLQQGQSYYSQHSTLPQQQSNISNKGSTPRFFSSWTIYFIVIAFVVVFAILKAICLRFIRQNQQRQNNQQNHISPEQEMTIVTLDVNDVDAFELQKILHDLNVCPYKNLPKNIEQNENRSGTNNNNGGADDVEDECVICQQAFELDEPVVVLPCEHYFHDECIKRWIYTRGASVRCPLCSQKLIGDTENDNESA